MRYATALFDFDHTLLDSDVALERALTATLGAFDVPDPEAHYESFDALNRALWKQVESGTMKPPEIHIERFRQVRELLGLDATADALAARFGVELGAHGDLYPGASELLDRLAEAGTTMAMVTNGLSEVQRARIDRLGIGRYFEVVVISAEVGVSKPRGEIFDITFERLGSPDPAGAVMIGDNLPSDIKGGVDYGIATCWYNPGAASAPPELQPTHTVGALADIAAVVLGEPPDVLPA